MIAVSFRVQLGLKKFFFLGWGKKFNDLFFVFFSFC